MFDYLEANATENERKEGYDIADYLLKMKPVEAILQQMIRMNPALKTLIKTFDLKLISIQQDTPQPKVSPPKKRGFRLWTQGEKLETFYCSKLMSVILHFPTTCSSKSLRRRLPMVTNYSLKTIHMEKKYTITLRLSYQQHAWLVRFADGASKLKAKSSVHSSRMVRYVNESRKSISTSSVNWLAKAPILTSWQDRQTPTVSLLLRTDAKKWLSTLINL